MSRCCWKRLRRKPKHWLRAAALAAMLGGAATGAPMSRSAYVATLDQCLAEVRAIAAPADAARLNQELPASWEVEGTQVPLDWLHAGLASLSRPPLSPAIERSLAARLQWMREEAGAGAEDTNGARARLNAILARREFQRVAGETAADRFWARMRAAAIRWLLRLLGQIGFSREAGNGLLLTLLLLACSALAWVLLKLAGKTHTAWKLAGGAARPPRSWQEWARMAQAAAAGGRWREAIGYAYSAGLARLAAEGVLRLDWSRTPRETTRALAGKLGEPDERYSAWRQLSQAFEASQFGGTTADEATARRALSALAGLEPPAQEPLHAV